MRKYDHQDIEQKWQKKWAEQKIYQAHNVSKKPKFYCLDMFPYPSADGLHVGHPEGYTATDIISRYSRMKGKNVLHPMGWDSFGLPAENFAIKKGIHPHAKTQENIKTFRRQIQSLGFSYDWSRQIDTSSPLYYKWTQWLFLQLYKKGLAYKKKAPVNWCENCKTVLANEQVVAGKCERCENEVIQKDLEQWFFKVTAYAEELLEKIDKLDWSDALKTTQKNWIGRSEGAEIEFRIHRLPPTPSQGGGDDPSLALPKGEGKLPGYYTTDAETWRLLQDKVLEMRKNPTEAEEKLWQCLRKNNDYHFRRQHIINKFIVDFVCFSKNLIIEVDGDIHNLQQEKDEERTKILKTFGFKVIRFKNEEVLKNIDYVVNEIINILNHISDSSVLPFGEGQGGVREDLGGVKVFTTRPDTLFGATYMALAPENPLVQKLKPEIKNWPEVEKYIKQARKKSQLERTDLAKEKTGVELQGVKAINPATKKEIPVWVADYVMINYGTGAIMAVTGHDERDWEFAKKYNLPIEQVVAYLFTDKEGKDAVRPDKPTVRRQNAYAFLKHWQEDKYLCLNWEKYNWHSGIIGGVDANEDAVAAAEREIKEKTGYQNFRLVRKLGGEFQQHFFAAHKDENRYAYGQGFLFKLIDGEHEKVQKEHLKNHQPIWIEGKKMKDFLNLDCFKYMWNILAGGSECFTGEGALINSGEFTGLNSKEAREKITKYVGGKKQVQYKIRDWLISRQRYWGAPIPIIYCQKCGEVPVPQKNLPVFLPEDVDFKPTGESPLARSKKFHQVKCPKCGAQARRESDTMDTFVCSSWYFLRYCDAHNQKEPFDKKLVNQWLPVDLYIGGMEHAVGHLIYSRFITKVLRDLGYLKFNEPFLKIRNQGLILAEDGRKMSKRWGNVISPDEVVEEYGADTMRMYEMFMGPFEDHKPWSKKGIIGIRRFLERVLTVFNEIMEKNLPKKNNYSRSIHKTVKKVTDDIDNFRFNTAISELMIFFNGKNSQPDWRPKLSQKGWERVSNIGKAVDYKALEVFLKILSPFAPHLSEELWEKLGHQKSIFLEKWPDFDQNKIKDKEVNIVVQINGKVRGKFTAAPDIAEDEAKKLALVVENIKKYIEDEKDVVRVIFVRGKLINFVVRK